MAFLNLTGLNKTFQEIKARLAKKSDTGHKHTVSDITNIATVGKTGSYTDLSNKPTIPTNNNQLTNGAGYQTASDVTSAISSAVGKITSFDAQVVTSLPATGAKGVIYLIADSHSDSNDSYDEYIWLEDKKVFEKVGNTDVDLSQYATTTAMNNALKGYLPTSTKYAASSSVGGAATSSVKATQDSDGNQINTTYLKKSGGTMTGQIESTSGGSWIADRNNAAVKNTNSTASPYKPVISSKTPSGNWTVGSWNNEYFYFNYTDDTTYSAGTNTSTIVILPNKAGTIALTSDIPTTLPANGGTASNVSGTVAVGHGGTGATTLASGQALIGNGTNAVTTRAIKDITTNSALGWTSGDNSLIDANTLAYWNGAYSGTSSSLKYCVKGAFGDIVTHNASEFAAASHNHDITSLTNATVTVNTTTDSWDIIGGNNKFLLKSIRTESSTPAWLYGNFASGIAFGGSDTKGVMSVGYSSPAIRFAGGNGTKPVWYISMGGISGDTYYLQNNIVNLSASGRTITITNAHGGTSTITTQDTTYSAATSSTLGLVKVGSNITNTSGTISLTKDNVTAALGYTPPTTNTTYGNATTSAAGLMSASDKSKLDAFYPSTTANSRKNHTPFIASDGVMEIGRFIDFHEDDNDTVDYSVRLNSASGKLSIQTTGDSPADVTANNFVGKWCGFTNDINTENSSDTWVPVIRDNSLQHRVLSKETWTFTLEDGSTVTKQVTLG